MKHFTKSSTLWIIAGSSLLLLGASYASSMHDWTQQQSSAKNLEPMVVQSDRSMLIVSNRVLPSTTPTIAAKLQRVEQVKSELLQAPEKVLEQEPIVENLAEFSKVEKIKTMQTTDSDEIQPGASVQGSKQFLIALETVVEQIQQDSKQVENQSQVQGKKILPTIQAHAYENEIVVEFPANLARTSQIKRVLSRIMLSDSDLGQTNFMQPAKFNLAAKPFYLNQVRDKSNFSIRYPAQAYEYAKVLMNENAHWVEDDNQQYLHISIPLHAKDKALASMFSNPVKPISRNSNSQVSQYRQWAAQFAEEFNVPLDLAMAVMEVESAFNPMARSSSNALGLMQIKADAAGRDVFELIDGKTRSPSENELLNPENNIRIGVAYLGLLQHHYFAEVDDKHKKELLAISAYNSGLNTVFKLFAPTPEKAIEQLNALPINQIYQILKANHQTDEARQYVDKVLIAKQNNRQA